VPYRQSSVSKVKRWINNIALTVFNSLILQLLFAGAVVRTAMYVTTRQLGVLNMMTLPVWVKILVTVAFMDFMLYIWHLLNHEVPLLWQFHRVHHSDLNMDVSTATRFHIGELAISAIIKIALVFLAIRRGASAFVGICTIAGVRYLQANSIISGRSDLKKGSPPLILKK